MEKQNSQRYNNPVIKKILSLSFTHTNYNLAQHTYYNIGGSADIALLPSNEEELIHAFKLFSLAETPKFIIGGGTNLLISDKGFRGLVLIIPRINKAKQIASHTYYIPAGAELSWLVENIMLPNNYDGVGALTGIPGTVGGALFMNAGTTNGSICEFAKEVIILTSTGKKIIPITPDLFSYRSQSFCNLNDLIIAGIFQFKYSHKDQKAIYQHYLERRRNHQPSGFCCGSVFKNPPGNHAGKLIESCGLKGTRYGGAVISEKHANFIINENNATFEDVLHLINLAKTEVLKKFGIELKEEVKILFEDGCLQHCPHISNINIR